MPEMRFDDEQLDALLDEMKAESVSGEEMAAARDRVWHKLAGSSGAACSDFRQEFAAYHRGELAESRRLLFEDHLSRCAGCRKAWSEFQGSRPVIELPRRHARPAQSWRRWAIAAGVAAVALFVSRDRLDLAFAARGPHATVESVAGVVSTLDGKTLTAGATLDAEQYLRTATGGHATLRLLDGSRVEMNERTQLALIGRWSGETVQLDRGDVIVQAAKQRRGHLRVATSDSVASVKGTIFAVSSGSAGSVVAVVQGAVQVEQPGVNKVLTPGQQSTSNNALVQQPVQKTVAWSQNATQYYSLLAGFMQAESQLSEVMNPAVRTEPKLVPYLPANTVGYVAVPNFGDAIPQMIDVLEQRANDNEAMKQWWDSPRGESLRTMLDKLHSITPSLGDEVVLAVVQSSAKQGIPAVLAQIKTGQEETLAKALALITPQPAYSTANSLLIVASDAKQLAAVQSTIGQGAGSAFAQKIVAQYQSGGAGWLFGVDLASAMEISPEDPKAQLAGLSQMQYLFISQRNVQGVPDNRAALNFSGARTGVASWLGSPGSSGSAEYATSDSLVAVSAMTKSPRQAYDEMLQLAGRGIPELSANLQKFEAETGVNVGNDVAAALGSDFTFSLERPTVPMPGWVFAIEVLQPATLENTIRLLVNRANAEAKKDHPDFQIALQNESSNGYQWTTISSTKSPLSLTWTYDHGYLVMSNDRALALRSITTRQGGFPLVRSARYLAQLPGGTSVHNSGFFWLNTGPALAQLKDVIKDPAIQAVFENRNPTLVVLDGQTERIELSSRTRLTSLLLDLMTLGGQRHSQSKASEAAL